MTLYTVEEESEVGVIFEVLNNRGKPLSELEKVKNYLLFLASKLDVEQRSLPDEVNRTWTHVFERLMQADLTSSADEDQLLRSHWLMAYDHQAKNWTGSKSIKKRFNLKGYQSNHAGLLKDLLKYATSLKDASLAYCDIHRPERTDSFAVWKNEPKLRAEVAQASEKFRRVGVIAPFLPLLIGARLRFVTEAQKYLDLVRLCEVFAFRVYSWLWHRTNKGQSELFRLGRYLYGNELPADKFLSLEDAMTQLRRLLLKLCPNDAFENEFRLDDQEIDWYNWRGLTYFLYEYEEYLAKGEVVRLPWKDLETLDLAKTIEHILPQTPTDLYWTSRFDKRTHLKWTHDIGNLCLTTHNSSYGNKPFPEKKGRPGASYPCYANSNLYMERALTAYADWDASAIQARRQAMKQWALRRWHVAEVLSSESQTQDEQDLAED